MHIIFSSFYALLNRLKRMHLYQAYYLVNYRNKQNHLITIFKVFIINYKIVIY